jgi:hypothetical protein
MVLWRGSGWDVSVDDLGAAFDLEMRTDPINDLAAGGRSRAAARLQAISNLWQRLETVDGPQPASHYNSSASPDILIDSSNSPHFAQFQASAGLSLDALHAIRSGATLNALPVAHTGWLGQGGLANATVTAQVNARLANIRGILGLPAAENITNLATIIAMIIEVPVNSWAVNAPYPKAFAGGLMARTNFATILRQLPPNQAHAIATHAGAWRGELVYIARQCILPLPHAPAAVTRNTPVFRAGSAPGTANFGHRLRIGDWFEDLAGGTDRLTADDYRARHHGRAEADDLESLGSYGNKMDAGSYELRLGSALEAVAGTALALTGYLASQAPLEGAQSTGLAVGASGGLLAGHGLTHLAAPNRSRPIFEFRTLSQADQANIVAAGLELWDYVDAAHGHGPGGPNQLSLGKRLWNWLGSR